MKQRIKINESILKQIVSESVKRVLVELNEDEEKKSLRERQMESYEEAKRNCLKYLKQSYDPKVDKRKYSFKYLQRGVIEVWMVRMNNFGKILGLPTYYDLLDSFNNGVERNN